jgi:TP901 family phage tail tape measure protein
MAAANTAQASLILKAIDEVTAPARHAMASLAKLNAEFRHLNAVEITKPQREFQAVASAITRDVQRVEHQTRQMRQSFHAMTPPSFNVAGMVGRLTAIAGAYISLREGIDGTIGAAREQNAAMAEIAIKTGLSDAAVVQFHQRLADLAPTVNQTTSALIGGIDVMTTLGLSAKDASEAIPAIGRAATGAGARIEDLAAATVAAVQNAKVAPAEITKLLDVMTSAGNAGAVELRDLAQFLPQLTASAQALGIEGVNGVADLSAALEIARRGAGTASEAATNTANFLGKIASPEVRKNFKKFGVDVTKELERAHERGISPIEHFIKLIDKKTKGGRADLLGQLFGDKQVTDFVRPMIADFREYLRIRDEAARATGTVATAYARRMQTAEQKMAAFRIRMENLGAAIGEHLLEPIGDVADHLAGLFDSVSERATVFDTFAASARGLLKGLGFNGADLSFQLKGIEDALLGPVEGAEEAADRIGAAFERFRQIGADVRAFLDACGDVIASVERFTGLDPAKANAVLGAVAGAGAKLAAVAVGITAAATAIRSMAAALYLISGAKLGVSVLRSVASLAGIGSAAKMIEAAVPAAPAGAPAATTSTAAAPVAGASVIPLASAIALGGAVLSEANRRFVAALDKQQRATLQGPVAGALAPDLAFGAAIVDASESGQPPTRDPWGEWVASWFKAAPEINPAVIKAAQTERAQLQAAVAALEAGPTLLPGPSRPTTADLPGKAADDRAAPARPAAAVPTIAPVVDVSRAMSDLSAFADKLADDLTLTVRPALDTAAMTHAQADALAASRAMRADLGITARPVVDTSSIDAALARTRALAAAIAGIGGVQAPATSPAAANTLPFGGPRAKGGRVRRGLSYLIGEEGPEIMTAGADGFVTPNHALGGRGAPHVTLHAPITMHLKVEGGGNAEAIAERVLAKAAGKLEEALLRSRQVLFGGTQNFEY